MSHSCLIRVYRNVSHLQKFYNTASQSSVARRKRVNAMTEFLHSFCQVGEYVAADLKVCWIRAKILEVDIQHGTVKVRYRKAFF